MDRDQIRQRTWDSCNIHVRHSRASHVTPCGWILTGRCSVAAFMRLLEGSEGGDTRDTGTVYQTVCLYRCRDTRRYRRRTLVSH